jgi:long-subunit acyl-CoA synthetase (AMP-forming)
MKKLLLVLTLALLTTLCNAQSYRGYSSGSAALPARVHEAYTAATGQQIVERYGMSEALMIASARHDGPRIPGAVGTALPGVEIRITDDAGVVMPVGDTGGKAGAVAGAQQRVADLLLEAGERRLERAALLRLRGERAFQREETVVHGGHKPNQIEF